MAMAEPRLAEVRPQPLSGIVLHSVREAIVEGRLRPGAPIREAELAKQLGTSRAPLREALRQLEREGLVSHAPYRGTTVTPLTARGIRELQSFRRLLETFAAEQIIARDGVSLDSLQELVERMEVGARDGDVTAINIADVSFHTRIVELSDNSLLLDVWRGYVQRIRRALALRNRANQDLDSLVALHRDLLAALRARDLEHVKRCYEMHGADVAVALQHLFEPEAAEPTGLPAQSA